MKHGRIVASVTLTGVWLVFCNRAVPARAAGSVGVLVSETVPKDQPGAKEIYGARVCAGEDAVIAFCDRCIDVSEPFQVTGWDKAQVHVSSGNQIVPKSDGIVFNKKGFYRVVFEATPFLGWNCRHENA